VFIVVAMVAGYAIDAIQLEFGGQYSAKAKLPNRTARLLLESLEERGSAWLNFMTLITPSIRNLPISQRAAMSRRMTT
jgi:hypothetical protein